MTILNFETDELDIQDPGEYLRRKILSRMKPSASGNRRYKNPGELLQQKVIEKLGAAGGEGLTYSRAFTEAQMENPELAQAYFDQLRTEG